MERNVKQKPLLKGFLTLTCIGLLLSGCGASDEEPAVENAGQEITEADIKAPAPSPEPDSREEPVPEKTAEENPEENEAQTDSQEVPSDTTSLYEQFLHNEISLTTASAFPQEDYRTSICEPNTAYTLSELGARVSEYYLNPEYTDKTSYDSIQYTYVNSPDSTDTAKKNLLIKFIGLNIYAPDDESYIVFVVSENEGQLSLTYEYECWARSGATAYTNGLLNSDWSGGAGDQMSGLSAILADGSYANIYAAEELYGWWTSYINDTIYKETFDENTVVNLIASIYTIGDAQYYLYDLSQCTEEEIPLCETFIERCRTEAGINWVSEEEVQAAVQNRCAALGIDYSATQAPEKVTWTDL